MMRLFIFILLTWFPQASFANKYIEPSYFDSFQVTPGGGILSIIIFLLFIVLSVVNEGVRLFGFGAGIFLVIIGLFGDASQYLIIGLPLLLACILGKYVDKKDTEDTEDTEDSQTKNTYSQANFSEVNDLNSSKNQKIYKFKKCNNCNQAIHHGLENDKCPNCKCKLLVSNDTERQTKTINRIRKVYNKNLDNPKNIKQEENKNISTKQNITNQKENFSNNFEYKNNGINSSVIITWHIRCPECLSNFIVPKNDQIEVLLNHHCTVCNFKWAWENESLPQITKKGKLALCSKWIINSNERTLYLYKALFNPNSNDNVVSDKIKKCVNCGQSIISNPNDNLSECPKCGNSSNVLKQN